LSPHLLEKLLLRRGEPNLPLNLGSHLVGQEDFTLHALLELEKNRIK
jgi:hypothetical protein